MYKILLVEDSKSYNNNLSSKLRTLGYEVFQEYSLKGGLTRLKNSEIDYLLLDLILPDGEGDDLLFEITSNENYKNTKTIILSGANDIQRRNHLFEHGIIEFFSKNVPINKLSEDIHELIITLSNNKSKNILVVDDSTFVRRSIADILISKNYNVNSFESAKEALDFLKNKDSNIDLIFSDVEMPIMNGIEFLIEIKKNSFLSNIPTIILSSTSDREQYARALRNGAVDFIKKPFLIEEILLKTDLHIKQSDANKKIIKQANELEEYKRVLGESDIISKTNSSGVITYVNDKFCEISGYKKEELIGKNHNIVRHPDVPKSLFKELWETVKAKKTFKGIVKNRKKNGESYYVDATISPILDINGEIDEIIGIRHDITDVMNPKRQLMDDLKYIEQPILILAQIVNFDILKEFYSENLMNIFEESFSKTLLSYFPKYSNLNKVYILGNGLFAFLKSQNVDATTVDLCLQEVITNLNKGGITFEGNKYDIDLVLSFSNTGSNLYDDAIIGIAQALEEKKEIVYAQNFYKVTQIEARNKLKMLTTIRDAIREKGKIISYYQPIIDNQTKQIVKYESLIRIVNKKNEVLSPFFFLELAKKTGYYHDITVKVIENAHDILRYSKVNININLSASDIENLTIRNKLLDLITKPENKNRVTFELLEDENVKDFKIIKDFIALAKIVGGVTIAIDDFGSGYSNFERILDFQPDYIKIDGSLIKNIEDSNFSKSVVKALILFAKENSMKTVAEFVSDEKIFDIVTELGIDYSQGYFLGKPEPIILT